MDVTEFLLARIADEEAAEVAADRAEFMRGVPDDMYVPAALAHDRAAITQSMRLRHRFRALGWAMAGMLCRPLVRRRAAAYSGHPDYRDEWR